MVVDGFVEVDPADALADEFFRVVHALLQIQKFIGIQHLFFQLFQARLRPMEIR